MSQEAERVYTINLGKALLSPNNQRSKRAINMIREFATRHMKTEQVKIDQELSQSVWKRGIRRPPRKIRVKMAKTEEGYVLVSPYEEEKPKEEEKSKAKSKETKPEKELEEQIEEQIETKPEEKEGEEIKEEILEPTEEEKPKETKQQEKKPKESKPKKEEKKKEAQKKNTKKSEKKKSAKKRSK